MSVSQSVVVRRLVNRLQLRTLRKGKNTDVILGFYYFRTSANLFGPESLGDYDGINNLRASMSSPTPAQRIYTHKHNKTSSTLMLI